LSPKLTNCSLRNISHKLINLIVPFSPLHENLLPKNSYIYTEYVFLFTFFLNMTKNIYQSFGNYIVSGQKNDNLLFNLFKNSAFLGIDMNSGLKTTNINVGITF
jgi:hypothetical protein